MVPLARHLLNVVKTDETVNSAYICRAITCSLLILWLQGIVYKRVLLLVSDQAQYKHKAGRDLRSALYSNMRHVTCLAHALHSLSELARKRCPVLDRFVSVFKKFSARSARRRRELREHLSVTMPSFPVPTRWGTWTIFCEFISGNIEELRWYLTSQQQDNDSILCKYSQFWRELQYLMRVFC